MKNMEIRYFIDTNIKTERAIEQILSIVDDYKNTYELNTSLRSIQLSPQFNVEGSVAWIVGENFILFGEERFFDYVVSDQTGLVEYVLTESGECYPHIENEKYTRSGRRRKKKKKDRNKD